MNTRKQIVLEDDGRGTVIEIINVSADHFRVVTRDLVTKATRGHEFLANTAVIEDGARLLTDGIEMMRYLGHEAPTARSWRDVVTIETCPEKVI